MRLTVIEPLNTIIHSFILFLFIQERECDVMWRMMHRRRNAFYGLLAVLVMTVLFNLKTLLSRFQWNLHHVNQTFRDGVLITMDVNKHITRQHMEILTQTRYQSDTTTSISKESIKIPDVSSFLPHLKGTHEPFEPALKFSKNRKNVTFTIGIPHVDRKIAFYLNDTLNSAIGNLSPGEANDCLIIVFFCDKNHTYNVKASKETAAVFKTSVESGLMDLIVVPQSFYPDLDALAQTADRNGDSIERWKWRSRENLDAAFLMNYAYPRSKFYVMSEDDVTTVPGYLSRIKEYALKPRQRDWLFIRFSNYGSIGVLFPSHKCPLIVNYLLLFYNVWPIDWLLEDYMLVQGCSWDTGCVRKKRLELKYRHHLFKHIGKYSSLKGKSYNIV